VAAVEEEGGVSQHEGLVVEERLRGLEGEEEEEGKRAMLYILQRKLEGRGMYADVVVQAHVVGVQLVPADVAVAEQMMENPKPRKSLTPSSTGS